MPLIWPEAWKLGRPLGFLLAENLDPSIASLNVRFWPLADLDSVLILSEPTSAIGKSGHSARPTVRFTLRTGHSSKLVLKGRF